MKYNVEPPAGLTPGQVRAARALLNAKQERLAFLAGVGLATLRRFEGGQDIGATQRDAIRRALEEAGVVFVAGGLTATGILLGAGVAMRPGAARSPANDACAGGAGRRCSRT